MPILPPETLGMLGGGQLGRMFTQVAREMGYEVIVLDPDPHSPAGSLASEHVCADYTDPVALRHLAERCAAVTTEFENIPAEALQWLAGRVAVHPSAEALAVAQNRIREKTFIRSLGLPTSPFIALSPGADDAALDDFDYPAILKTATLGYDGKGQVACNHAGEARAGLAELGVDCILERRIDLALEVSVVLGRGSDGRCHCFPLAENRHANGILDLSLAPAGVSDDLAEQARQAATAIANGLDYRGVLAVEFFVSTDGELLVNEIAPRPHNSGHYTQDACACSQFELQLRMICDLPPGDMSLRSPVVMLNLLGDLWPEDGQPDWLPLLSDPRAHLHLYGKRNARPGRKMGHVNLLGASRQQIEAAVEAVRSGLLGGACQG